MNEGMNLRTYAFPQKSYSFKLRLVSLCMYFGVTDIVILMNSNGSC